MSGSAPSPLTLPVFRAFWLAMVFSHVGTFAHDVGAQWAMTELSPSPLLVTLIQVAGTLPVFLLGLPSGALADIVDRRRLVIAMQLAMCTVAAALGAAALAGSLTPAVILVATALLAVGTALSTPALQATLPELVPAPSLPGALALSSATINIARAVGPALGGIAVGMLGPGPVFLFNGASFLGLAFVLWRWRREASATRLPAESFLGAMNAGIRYTRHSPRFRAVLARVAAFVIPASGMWALLPVAARQDWQVAPSSYGLLLTALGAGALAATALLSPLRARLSLQSLTLAATAGFAVATAALSQVRSPLAAGALLFAAGVAWLLMMASLNLAAQTELPAWVKARGLAVNLLVFSGAMALGGFLWGLVAQRLSVSAALLGSGVSGLAGLLPAAFWKLRQPSPEEYRAAHPWPEPTLAREIVPDDGPVLVTVEYRIDPARRAEFLDAIATLPRARLRDGAYRWSLHEDLASEGLFLESFEVESWAEHLRQHDRVAEADAHAERAVDQFHLGPAAPPVRHLLAARVVR